MLLVTVHSSCHKTSGLHEERAVLLGCLGQHHQALAIYVHTLGDTDAALNYCNKHYSSSGSGSEVSVAAFIRPQQLH